MQIKSEGELLGRDFHGLFAGELHIKLIGVSGVFSVLKLFAGMSVQILNIPNSYRM